MIKETFIVPIYDCQVDVFVTKHVETVAEKVNYNEDCSGSEGLTLSYPLNPGIYCVIFKKRTLNPGVVAHEAYHLTAKIMQTCDIKYDIDNIEPFAYLNGYLVQELHKIIWQ